MGCEAQAGGETRINEGRRSQANVRSDKEKAFPIS